jgi:hypothetical protein
MKITIKEVFKLGENYEHIPLTPKEKDELMNELIGVLNKKHYTGKGDFQPKLEEVVD